MLWYQKDIQTIFETLETSENGISDTEAVERIHKYGANKLAVHKEPWWKVVIEPFKSVFVYVLLLAAAVSLLSHEPLDAVIITVIISVNAIIFYVQHYSTSRVLKSLTKHSKQEVTVVRGGESIVIDSVDIVPGDIIKMAEGERVPADARVVHEEIFLVDESSLTGESKPVNKHGSHIRKNRELYEQSNMVFQGSYVVSGSAVCVVVETGANTEFGKIAGLASVKPTTSPVQEKINDLIAFLVKAILGMSSVVFVLSLARGIAPAEALRFVLSLSVSAVPEGLPVALTVILVLGMKRMAKHNALVRSFKAIEDIGLVTVIATDKTGTLTKNLLSVVDSWSMDHKDVTKYAAMTVGDDAHLGDPLDKAIRTKLGLPKISPAKIYPFDISIRMSGAYFSSKGVVHIKGSPEHILQLSKVTAQEHTKVESAMHSFTSHGYRVIAFAKFESKKEPASLSEIKKGDLEFVGLISFADELRPEAKKAIAAAQKAGIEVKMITGDHFETAYNIGRQLGLASHEEQVVKGTDISSGTADLYSQVNEKSVFARILPDQKFNILQALKKSHITAMTGDGVNDVPALANAHVGISMGSGSSIAKDAGGIILLDDNFATIIRAVSEGRKIYDNIRRMLYYLLSTSLGEVLTMMIALVAGLPLPVTAIQILWINLVTDTALVLPLGLEPEEQGHMDRPPRKPGEPLLSKILLSRMVIVSLTMSLTSIATMFYLLSIDYTNSQVQTVIFTTLVVAQWANSFNARSEFKSSFTRLQNINYGLLVGLGVGLILQAVALFGGARELLGIVEVDTSILIWCSSISVLSVIAVAEIHKYVVNLLQKQD